MEEEETSMLYARQFRGDGGRRSSEAVLVALFTSNEKLFLGRLFDILLEEKLLLHISY